MELDDVKKWRNPNGVRVGDLCKGDSSKFASSNRWSLKHILEATVLDYFIPPHPSAKVKVNIQVTKGRLKRYGQDGLVDLTNQYKLRENKITVYIDSLKKIKNNNSKTFCLISGPYV